MNYQLEEKLEKSRLHDLYWAAQKKVEQKKKNINRCIRLLNDEKKNAAREIAGRKRN